MLNLALTQWCKAPQVHPPDPEGMRLRHIQVMTRHGMRSPIEIYLPRNNRGVWNCYDNNTITPRRQSGPVKKYRFFNHRFNQTYAQYGPTCGAGTLTNEGQQMHVDLGKTYHDYLVNMGFLPSKIDPTIMRFTSSPIDRCFRSAESFILGLYPPEDPNEVINIESGSDNLQPLVLNAQHTKGYADLLENFTNSEEVKKFYEDHAQAMSEFMEYMGAEKSWGGMADVCSWTLAYNCSDVSPIIPQLTDNVMWICRNLTKLQQYGLARMGPTRGFAIAYTMRYMLDIADQAASNDFNPRFVLLSSHDTTLSALLVLLNDHIEDVEEVVPRYASHITMELWEDELNEIYVRFVYNGKVVIIPDFGTETIKFNTFRQWVEPLIDCNQIEKQ